MLSFDIAGHRFHLRAAAVVIDDAQVLLHRVEGDAVWALPGGRVEPGEDASAAVVREMREETGEAVVCGELLHLIENFFVHRGVPQHEVGLYFRATLPASSRLLAKDRSHAGSEGDERLEFRWFPLADLPHVNLHPEALRRTLAQAGPAPLHLVQRG